MSEVAAGSPSEETEVSPEDICRKYRKISRFRPPFHFEASEPPYPEANESRLFELEERVFNLNSYPSPPESPSLKASYEDLQKKHSDLLEGMRNITVLDVLHEEDPHPSVEGEIQTVRAQTGHPPRQDSHEQKNTLFGLEKEHWERHYKAKKLFFHQALSYLYLLEAHHPEEEERQKSRRLRRETYAMFIGHQATTYSRSASHELGPVRRDKQPTIIHPYRVAVHGINFWLQKIDQAKTDEEEESLFEELNMEIIRDLFHDTQEDYYITESDLACKLIEMLNFDFRVSTRFRESDSVLSTPSRARPPENINFACTHRDEIMRELWALTEEEADKDPKGDSEHYYLARKLSEIPRGNRARVYLSKVRDRMNNLQSPRYKKAGKTLIKLHETLKILDIGLAPLTASAMHPDEYPNISCKDLSTEMLGLVHVCLAQMELYKETEEFKRLCEENIYWNDYWEITDQQLEYYKETLTKDLTV